MPMRTPFPGGTHINSDFLIIPLSELQQLLRQQALAHPLGLEAASAAQHTTAR